MAYRVMPRGQNLTYYLMKAVEANTAARDSERAEELRHELIAAARQTPNSWVGVPLLKVALGPEHHDVLDAMLVCLERAGTRGAFPVGLPELLETCRERFPADRDVAAIVAGGLHEIAFRIAGDPKLVPMLEYCVEATRTATASLAPRAHQLLAQSMLAAGHAERALEVATAGIGLCTGLERELWNGWLEVERARCLDALGREGFEAILLATYPALERFGLASEAHRLLQDHYLAEGRPRQGLELALRRLGTLLRRSEPPRLLHETLWRIVRTPAGQGGPAELSVTAARKACAVYPQNIAFRLGLGTALLRTGRPEAVEEAVGQLAEAARLRTERQIEAPTALPAVQTIAFAQLGRSTEARAALDRAREQLALAPDDLTLRTLVAEAEAAVGR